MSNAWSGDWLIPKRVVLPGLRIRVRILPREGAPLFGQDASWVYFVGGGAQISIADDMPLARQRYSLIHEMQHAMVELVDRMIEDFPQHVRTHTMEESWLAAQATSAKEPDATNAPSASFTVAADHESPQGEP